MINLPAYTTENVCTLSVAFASGHVRAQNLCCTPTAASRSHGRGSIDPERPRARERRERAARRRRCRVPVAVRGGPWARGGAAAGAGPRDARRAGRRRERTETAGIRKGVTSTA